MYEHLLLLSSVGLRKVQMPMNPKKIDTNLLIAKRFYASRVPKLLEGVIVPSTLHSDVLNPTISQVRNSSEGK